MHTKGWPEDGSWELDCAWDPVLVKGNQLFQTGEKQVRVNKSERLRIIKLPPEKPKNIDQGDTIIIPKTSKHRIENTGNDKLIFIEVQTGTYFGEDDIVRIEDDYNRIK